MTEWIWFIARAWLDFRPSESKETGPVPTEVPLCSRCSLVRRDAG